MHRLPRRVFAPSSRSPAPWECPERADRIASLEREWAGVSHAQTRDEASSVGTAYIAFIGNMNAPLVGQTNPSMAHQSIVDRVELRHRHIFGRVGVSLGAAACSRVAPGSRNTDDIVLQ